MRNILGQFRRELNAVLCSPVTYIALAVFLFFSGCTFSENLRTSRNPGMSDTLQALAGLMCLVVPLITMRLLSEEYHSGTIEILMTAPISDGQVILSKFLGALSFVGLMLLPTFLYVAIIAHLGQPQYGPMLAGYAAVALTGVMFVAFGLFCSALTRSQTLAALMTLVFLMVLWILGYAGEYVGGAFGPVLQYLGVSGHVAAFATGRVAFRDVFYFLSMTGLWLFLAARALESRRWR